MKLILKQVCIIAPHSPFHRKTKDILIVDGNIHSIEDHIDEDADRKIQINNLHVSIGWMDLFANFTDPGYEQRETLTTGAMAAAAGGFTDVMIIPNTKPVIGTKALVEYILNSSKELMVTVHPTGSVTKNAEGKELAEMYDMFHSGAKAFTDGLLPVQQSNIMIKALQYSLANNSLIIQIPEDRSLSAHGLMNEGLISTQLGLPGKPAIAEELMVVRDIELAKYTGARLHLTGISTKKSIELIAEAKKADVSVTCSVTPYHLNFCDEDLIHYDTNLKLNPPLRTNEDMMALRKALKDGHIDAIASHHNPLHWDDKSCEFENASSGMIGLESLFGATMNHCLSIDKFIEKMTITSRTIAGITVPALQVGAPARLTLFDPDAEYVFKKEMIRSRSANSAFIGKSMKGRVHGIISKNQIHIN
jgi:dihydroorotase